MAEYPRLCWGTWVFPRVLLFLWFFPQISRQKQALAEELVTTRKDCDKLGNQLQRVSREKEGLTQDKGELVVQVS